MVSGVPRFHSVGDWSLPDSTTDVDTPSGPFDTPNSSKSHRSTGVAAYPAHSKYRFRIAYLSAAVFAIGTGLTIYNITIGR